MIKSRSRTCKELLCNAMLLHKGQRIRLLRQVKWTVKGAGGGGRGNPPQRALSAMLRDVLYVFSETEGDGHTTCQIVRPEFTVFTVSLSSSSSSDKPRRESTLLNVNVILSSLLSSMLLFTDKSWSWRSWFSRAEIWRRIIVDDWLDCYWLPLLFFLFLFFFEMTRSNNVLFSVSTQLMLFRCSSRSAGARQELGKRTHSRRDRRLLRLSRHGPSISRSPRLAPSGSFVSALESYLNECRIFLGFEFPLVFVTSKLVHLDWLQANDLWSRWKMPCNSVVKTSLSSDFIAERGAFLFQLRYIIHVLSYIP